MMSGLLLVCLGSAVGGGLRYLVAVAAGRLWGDAFPYGTLAVNLVGCFLIGFANYIAVAALISEETRLFVSTGVLGGMTTYSAFSYESVRLVQLGDWRGGFLNVAVTTVGCLLLCLAGMLVAERLGRI